MAKPGVQVLGLCLGPQSSLQSPSSLQWPSVYPFPLTSHPPTSSDKLHSAFKTASGGMPLHLYQAGPCGTPGHKSLSVSPHFLITGNRFHLAFMTGLPLWLSGKESACQCRKHRFDPWVGNIPWRRKWQPNPVLLPGKSHVQRSMVATVHGGHKTGGQDLATKQQQSLHNLA